MNENRTRTIRSFVKREGRITKSQQLALKNLLPNYELPTQSGILNFDEIFGIHYKLFLEIGFGNGNSLIHMAENFPEINFIGIEVYRPGIGVLLNEINKKKLNNIKIFCEDAIDVFENNIPNNSLDCIQIFFPDPWPKKRHHKRRLLKENFVKFMKNKLKNNGLIHIKTDCDYYAQNIIETMTNLGFKISESLSKTNHIITKFEERGIKSGHKIFDLQFIC